jgi:hypothetical protein
MIRQLKSVSVALAIDPTETVAVTAGPQAGTTAIWLRGGACIGCMANPQEVLDEIAAYKRGDEWEKPAKKGPRPPGSNGLHLP